jgi:hypothetical protein
MPFLGTTGGGSVRQFGGLANLGYFIKNSLRFRTSGSTYLNRTFGTATSRTTWTKSFWVKRGTIGVSQQMFASRPTSTPYSLIYFGTGDKFEYDEGSIYFATTQLFRDPAAWYHIVLAVDTTQATNTNRFKVYINGSQITAFDTTTYPSPNYNTQYNSATNHTVGKGGDYTNEYFDGYMTEINFIDGQALTPSSFGKTDAATGQWIPKKFAGTYGTNGFYLKFADTSGITAATIGKDSSGNGNNFTPSGISNTTGATYDFMIDSPTLSAVASNYCVMNPLDAQGTATLTDGNLTIASAGATHRNRKATFMLPSTGKWYWELTTASTCSASVILGWGLQTTAAPTNSSAGETGSFMAQNDANQDIWNQGTNVISTGSAVAANAIRQVAYDADTGKLWFGINDVWYSSTDLTSGNPSAGTNQGITLSAGNYFPAITPYNMTANVNFGQRPFAYTPPTGFKSLNTYNLP